jgi:hypothetical protein
MCSGKAARVSHLGPTLGDFFEGLDSECGIYWRVSGSMALRPFLGYDLTESTPDHSKLSRIWQRLPVEAHDEVGRRRSSMTTGSTRMTRTPRSRR